MPTHQRDPYPPTATSKTVLESFVEQICELTRADGAAIAVSEAGNLVCRASFGNAPAVGATVGPEARFTQQCVQTGQLVHCRDTVVDPRFQTIVAREVPFRSAMAVPIVVEESVIGVVEAFSSRALGFNEEDAAVMQRHAALLALFLEEADALAPPYDGITKYEVTRRVLAFPSRRQAPPQWFRAALKALGF